VTPVMQTKFGREGNCLAACLASAFDLSLQNVPEFEGEYWMTDLEVWLELMGFRLVHQSSERTDQLGVAIGDGPRRLRHAVLWKAGQMLHDPHPDNTGLSQRPDLFLYWEPF
jgi:hypothetical protein